MIETQYIRTQGYDSLPIRGSVHQDTFLLEILVNQRGTAFWSARQTQCSGHKRTYVAFTSENGTRHSIKLHELQPQHIEKLLGDIIQEYFHERLEYSFVRNSNLETYQRLRRDLCPGDRIIADQMITSPL